MYLLFTIALAIGLFFLIRRKENTVFAAIISIIYFLLFWLINFKAMPVLNFWGFHGVWFQLTLTACLGAILSYVDNDLEFYPYDGSWLRWVPLYICLTVFVVMSFSSLAMFHSRKYQELLTVENASDKVFNEELHPIPVDKMCLVPYDIALNRARKTLGEVPGLASVVEIGKMTKQTLTADFEINDGKRLKLENALIYVAPLEHISFFKWNANRVTPGYVIVDATDANKVYLVKKINGKSLKLRYTESACFGSNIERYIRKNGFASEGITDYCFELDHEGNPHWVLANFEKTIGFGGSDVKGIITVNAQTGEIDKYSIEDSPAWADRVQPGSFISDQINDWGSFRKGWWNSIFAEIDVEKATDCMSLVDIDGKSFWYTGIRSSGTNDDATSGFVLVDSKTKRTILYRISGISERRAMFVAEKLSIPGDPFSVSLPILYNVSNIPTYFMLLTRGDAVVGYCFVSVKDEEVIDWGTDVKTAERNYLNKYYTKQLGARLTDGPVENKENEFIVDDITNENDLYYMRLKGAKGKEFVGSSANFPKLRWTKPGHKILMSYREGNDNLLQIESFSNKSVD